MTRKQLESVTTFVCAFHNNDLSIEWINSRYGLQLTESTTREEALAAFLEARGIELDSELLINKSK